jgi:zinc transport system permease protein
VSTIAGILLPIELELPVPSGAAIILLAGAMFALAAVLRGLVPALKGQAG